MTDTTTLDTVAERVARGVALLDEKQPGWVDRIDLSRLNLWSGSECILGQLYADFVSCCGFHAGSRMLGIDFDGASYGFVADEDGTASYEDLTAEWVRVITDRRSSFMNEAASRAGTEIQP